MKLVITGGHHTSALPVMEEIQKLKPDCEFIWIGHKHSMARDNNPSAEFQDITALGIQFYDIGAQKFYRVYNPLKLMIILFGVVRAYKLLRKLRPDGVLSFGGYIAFPVVVAASALKIPSVTHEQILVAGISNKAISFFVKKIFVSHKETKKYYNRSKVIFTGLPLRKEIFSQTSNVFIFSNSDPVLYVTGGKQGSHRINMALKGILPELLEFCNVIHQCGSTTEFNDLKVFEDLKENLPTEKKGKYYVAPYITKEYIGEVMAKADLVVSRSGAHTVFELVALAKRAILIPITNVARNEQVKNALLFSSTGLGKIIYEKDLTPNPLLSEIKYMLEHKSEFNPQGTGAFVINTDSAKTIAYETCQAIFE